MPVRNVSKVDVAEQYYHVYARGASKRVIFPSEADYTYFVRLFARYLSPDPQMGKDGMPYPQLRGKVELLAYCVMPNHFHLLLYQVEQGAMSQLMKSVMTSYGRYFNLKYKRSGSIYESTYKASRVSSDGYLQHISRYIHLNPRYWQRYRYSSVAYYLGASAPEWLQPGRVTSLFGDAREYKQFLEDYEERRAVLVELKHELADS